MAQDKIHFVHILVYVCFFVVVVRLHVWHFIYYSPVLVFVP